MGSLTLTFEPVDRWYGELTATVASDGFAGMGSAWIDHATLLAFADRLSEYPLKDSPPLSISGRHLSLAEEDPSLSFTLTPHDARGGIRVWVELAAYARHPAPHMPDSRVRTGFVVSYTDLERFQRGLRRLVKGNAEEALLTRQMAEVDTF